MFARSEVERLVFRTLPRDPLFGATAILSRDSECFAEAAFLPLAVLRSFTAVTCSARTRNLLTDLVGVAAALGRRETAEERVGRTTGKEAGRGEVNSEFADLGERAAFVAELECLLARCFITPSL